MSTPLMTDAVRFSELLQDADEREPYTPPLKPEQRLLLALILDAATYARKAGTVRCDHARAWFRGAPSPYRFSARFVFRELNLDHRHALAALEEQWAGLRNAPVFSIRHSGRGVSVNKIVVLRSRALPVRPLTWADVVKRKYPVRWYRLTQVAA